MNSLPRIRTGLLRHSLDKQVLVYDSRDDRVHLLDPTTACVLELLEEGGWTPEGITHELAGRIGVARDPGLLTLALDQLGAADLLDKSVPVPAPLAGVNRRELVRKLAMTGAAALLIPAIATLTATPGLAQGSQRPDGSVCDNGGQCVSTRCCGGICGNSICFDNGNDSKPPGGCNPGTLDVRCCSCLCHQSQDFCIANPPG